MSLIYSCVVDGAPKFQDQAQIFLRSLLATGVEPNHIHMHLTTHARQTHGLAEAMAEYGIVLHDLKPFLDGAYCNKLVQLDTLPLGSADCVALCDTDLAFLHSLESEASSRVVRAKPVDLPNPPIAFLERSREICGLNGNQPVVRTSCEDAPTWISNCNGGLYLLPSILAPTIAASWKKHATTLHATHNALEGYAHHIDQISFAMAMLDLGLEIDPLMIEDNFPLHLSDRFAPDAEINPRVLHYHWLHDGGDRLLETGHASLDRAVRAVNLRLKVNR
ncbi:hypothetical protein NAC44_10050 [Allorhizobium sp. BGMRC 0089]|uniref:hypothetical protein n=1 Tax=Allorhizobium sonneratiae TaxID=2934936 RepID=UPI002034293F|nr:hypothetical protein [Allorhizobium sonneratiae]MCM2292662.1 hypothetical protein [Allorhizobium sonneratiae]